jgi:hypothetical protein
MRSIAQRLATRRPAWALAVTFLAGSRADAQQLEPIRYVLRIPAPREDGGRLLVSGLLRDTPAYGSGLATDDELLAIDDFRLDPEGLDARSSSTGLEPRSPCSSPAAASCDLSE